MFTRGQRFQADILEAWTFPLMGAILRFLRSITSGADRRVVAPIYLQEICYRLLQAAQCSRLLDAAAAEHEINPVSQAIR